MVDQRGSSPAALVSLIPSAQLLWRSPLCENVRPHATADLMLAELGVRIDKKKRSAFCAGISRQPQTGERDSQKHGPQ